MAIRNPSRHVWLATLLVVLAVQVAMAEYSFTAIARSVANVAGTETPTVRLGVYDAHWVAIRLMGGPGDTAAPPFEFNHLGIRYMSAFGDCAFVEVHFAWTVAANLLALVLLGRGSLHLRKDRTGRSSLFISSAISASLR